jgi:hypothetical protein
VLRLPILTYKREATRRNNFQAKNQQFNPEKLKIKKVDLIFWTKHQIQIEGFVTSGQNQGLVDVN